MNDEDNSNNQKISELLLKNNDLEEKNKALSFFSNQIEVNRTLFTGMRLLLEKIGSLEKKLELKNKEKEEKNDKN